MSWTCDRCKQTFDSPCYHDCNLPKSQKPKSPLTRVRKPEGRVDLLFARLIEEAVKRSPNPAVKKAYVDFQPAVEHFLHQQLGPRTKRGRKLAADLFTLRDIWEQAKRRRVA